MTILDVKKDIVNKTQKPLYIFYGNETACMSIYIHKLADNREVKYIDSIEQAKDESKSLLPKRYCYVIRDDIALTGSERLYKAINAKGNDNILIIILNTVDKRTKLYKDFQDYFVEFNRMSTDTLVKYVQEQIDLPYKDACVLIEVCENDYGRLMLEVDKIKTLKKSLDSQSESMILYELLNTGVIHIPAKDAIFDFVDSVLKADIPKAFNLLEQCYECGENTLVLLSVLYTNLKQMLQVQFCTSRDVERATGLTSWQIKCIREKMGAYTEKQIEYLMSLCRKMEIKIKQGEIDDSVVMPYILVHC